MGCRSLLRWCRYSGSDHDFLALGDFYVEDAGFIGGQLRSGTLSVSPRV
ncbi:MAG: hypothetical protein R3F11_00985 [Verrucomicrobiales bacterium]